MTARNEEGLKIAAKSEPLKGKGEALMAETLSCRAAIAWIKEKAWEKVIVESDLLQLVKAINCGIKMTSQVWGIILDYKDALEDIQTCFLVHVQKQPIRWLMP